MLCYIFRTIAVLFLMAAALITPPESWRAWAVFAWAMFVGFLAGLESQDGKEARG